MKPIPRGCSTGAFLKSRRDDSRDEVSTGSGSDRVSNHATVEIAKL
jgi:hypothetical protein